MKQQDVCGICARSVRLVFERHEARAGVICGGSGMSFGDSYDHDMVVAHNSSASLREARAALREADRAAAAAWEAYHQALDQGGVSERSNDIARSVGRLGMARMDARDSLIKALEQHVAWLERERERAEVAAIVTPAAQRAAFLAAMAPEVGP